MGKNNAGACIPGEGSTKDNLTAEVDRMAHFVTQQPLFPDSLNHYLKEP